MPRGSSGYVNGSAGDHIAQPGGTSQSGPALQQPASDRTVSTTSARMVDDHTCEGHSGTSHPATRTRRSRRPPPSPDPRLDAAARTNSNEHRPLRQDRHRQRLDRRHWPGHRQGSRRIRCARGGQRAQRRAGAGCRGRRAAGSTRRARGGRRQRPRHGRGRGQARRAGAGGRHPDQQHGDLRAEALRRDHRFGLAALLRHQRHERAYGCRASICRRWSRKAGAGWCSSPASRR